MQELRTAVRFPIKLPIAIQTDEDFHHSAQTEDISAGGVLFYVEKDLAIGSLITFSIAMRASVLGTPSDIMVKCIGRVVRCADENGRKAVAAVIDEYKFERH